MEEGLMAVGALVPLAILGFVVHKVRQQQQQRQLALREANLAGPTPAPTQFAPAPTQLAPTPAPTQFAPAATQPAPVPGATQPAAMPGVTQPAQAPAPTQFAPLSGGPAAPRPSAPRAIDAQFMLASSEIAPMRGYTENLATPPNPNDAHFGPCGGVAMGWRMWSAPDGETVGMMTDKRMLFATEEGAQRFLNLAGVILREGMPIIEALPAPGHDGFGYGVTLNSEEFGRVVGREIGGGMTCFGYAFREGCMVVVVSALQGTHVEAERRLTLRMVHVMAANAQQRVAAVLAGRPVPSLSPPAVVGPPPPPPRQALPDDIACSSCGEGHRPHYKFCLKCGALLPGK